MKKYTDVFQIQSLISSGSSGKVFKVKSKEDSKIYAAKLIENINSFLKEQIKRETDIMRIIKSPYALKIIDDFYDQSENTYCIVSEYMEKGDLKGYIEKKLFQATNMQILNFVMQISLAFIDLNTKNIIHRDLKPANILIANQGYYKLCDFGSSKFIQGEAFKLLKISAPFGTQLYHSPEIYFGQKGANYNKNVDVWPLGVIMYQIIYQGEHPIKTKDNLLENQDAENIFQGRKAIVFPTAPNIDPRIIELMKKMLAIKFQNRINWVGIIQFISKNFDYIIYKVEQILDHQIYLTKLLCLFVYHLNNQKNNVLFKEQTTQHKLSILTNCLIMYQFDKLKQTQLIMKKQIIKKRQEYVILPHCYQEFLIREKIDDFIVMRQKSEKFRLQIKEKFPIQKLQIQIQKICVQLLKIKIITQKFEKKQLQLLQLLSKLRKSFSVKNTNYMQTLFNSFM